MILSLFRRRLPPDPPPPAAIPAGQRVYAIGDIHGCAGLFAQLLAIIEADDAVRGPAATTIILLGDLVDRGPDSRAVIDLAMALCERRPATRWLIGNHEEVFEKALGGDPKIVRYFVRIGGGPTIESYGMAPDVLESATFEELATSFPPMVPAAHIAFLRTGEDCIIIGDYAFVHAGIRPGVPVEAQDTADLRWIRDAFLADDRHHGKVIVHGHTIDDAVQERPNRIGVDTGAYASGRLSAVGLEGTDRWFLDTPTETGVAGRATGYSG